MTPKKLNVYVGFPSYGGNGGISSEVPNVREWWVETVLKMKGDDRVDGIWTKTVGDTPIPMVRNNFVHLAREAGCDVLIMIDSDQDPGLHAEEEGFEPFWDTSFDFLYEHYEKGPCVIGAPYCGPPNGTENMYVFRWENYGVRGDETGFSLEQYTRGEAAMMYGIQSAAALPTGLVMYDMRCFDLLEPPYFYYEWNDEFQREKASTEDVTNTRDIAMFGTLKLGYNPVFCNWSSPIGHWKPWCVRGRPQPYGIEQVSDAFQRAVLKGQSNKLRTVESSSLVSKKMLEAAKDRRTVPTFEGNGSDKQEDEPSESLQGEVEV